MSCKHGRNSKWCCECRYGKCQEGDYIENPNVDAVTDVKRMEQNYNRKGGYEESNRTL